MAVGGAVDAGDMQRFHKIDLKRGTGMMRIIQSKNPFLIDPDRFIFEKFSAFS